VRSSAAGAGSALLPKRPASAPGTGTALASMISGAEEPCPTMEHSTRNVYGGRQCHGLTQSQGEAHHGRDDLVPAAVLVGEYLRRDERVVERADADWALCATSAARIERPRGGTYKPADERGLAHRLDLRREAVRGEHGGHAAEEHDGRAEERETAGREEVAVQPRPPRQQRADEQEHDAVEHELDAVREVRVRVLGADLVRPVQRRPREEAREQLVRAEQVREPDRERRERLRRPRQQDVRPGRTAARTTENTSMLSRSIVSRRRATLSALRAAYPIPAPRSDPPRTSQRSVSRTKASAVGFAAYAFRTASSGIHRNGAPKPSFLEGAE
jgi:hypothetical protein